MQALSCSVHLLKLLLSQIFLGGKLCLYLGHWCVLSIKA